MADKKLNAVSTASDGAYIYAEDASGNQIKISKADLASVVAGVMKIALKESSVPSGGTLNLGLSKGFLIVTSQSGGWSAYYVATFNSINEVSVDERASGQISVDIVDGTIIITNTHTASRNLTALLIGY